MRLRKPNKPPTCAENRAQNLSRDKVSDRLARSIVATTAQHEQNRARDSRSINQGLNRMAKYRDRLPQLGEHLFLTDSGLETTLIFRDGYELNQFASFELLKTESGRQRLMDYFRQHAKTAVDAGMGFVLEAATWRSNADWGNKLGYSPQALADLNRDAIRMLADVRAELETPKSPMVISGNIGPLGDGYAASEMSAEAAEAMHAPQVKTFADTEADMVSAFTMTSANEAIGVTRAAMKAGMPVVLSFTVETDGRLPTGQSLKDAIAEVDAATGGAPVYYMINCAHPTHFDDILDAGAEWVKRIRGVRANASKRSHAELDEAKDLDDGNPAELGQQYRALRSRFGHINVLGGCCGTDHHHIEQICWACNPSA
jgi:S-methylmethionine-dependent homocysteine/selenocysteine methylase